MERYERPRWVHLLAAVAFLILLFAVVPTPAHAAPGDSGTTDIWNWTVLPGNTLDITGCTAPAGDLTIPAQLDCGALGTLDVTAIDDDAFNGCLGLTGISIPHGVTSIGSGSFYNCTALASANLPDTLTSMGNAAFYNTALTAIAIPDGVADINIYAFWNCTQLKSVTLPASLATIGFDAFWGTGLESLTIPDGATTIGDYAFSRCSALSSVTLPDSLQSIGGGAFYNTALTSIIIPGGVTSVGGQAFYSSYSLAKVTLLNKTVSIGGEAFASTAIGSDGIYGFFGSTADQYASDNGYPFHTLYTVTFNTEGGSGVDNVIAVSGSTISPPTDPTKPLCYFTEWYQEESCINSWNFATDTVTSDKTLYAGWGPEYNLNDLNKLQTFLNLTSADGSHTNGWQLNHSYDPDDPTAWTGVTWDSSVPKRVAAIDVSDTQITGTLDLSGFAALLSLNCPHNNLTGLDLSGDAALGDIEFMYNQISSVDLTGCTAVTFIGLSYNDLTSLDVSSCQKLFNLQCYENQLKSLDVHASTSLTYLYCDDNSLSTLNIAGCDQLVDLICDGNHLAPAMSVHGFTHLDRFDCSGNQLTGLDVGGCTALRLMYCDSNQLAGLDASGLASLQELTASYNSLASLDLTGCTALTRLLLGYNQLSSVDVPVNLSNFDCTNDPLTHFHATVGSNALTLDAAGPGTFWVTHSNGVYKARAVPGTGDWFFDWESGGSGVSVIPGYALTDGVDYDLTARFYQALSLEASPANGQIYTGGRITITPNIAGGTWDFDASFLSQNGNQFTGLKEGTARVTYTFGGHSAYVDVTISASNLPVTGQDFTPALWLLALGALAGAAGLILIATRNRRKA